MNQRHDLVYLEDSRDAFEEVDDPAELTTVVNEDLGDDDPVAHANNLENTINEVEDPLEGARRQIGRRKRRRAGKPWRKARFHRAINR